MTAGTRSPVRETQTTLSVAPSGSAGLVGQYPRAENPLLPGGRSAASERQPAAQRTGARCHDNPNPVDAGTAERKFPRWSVRAFSTQVELTMPTEVRSPPRLTTRSWRNKPT